MAGRTRPGAAATQVSSATLATMATAASVSSGVASFLGGSHGGWSGARTILRTG
jgi:hypothetical protein